MTNLPVAAMTLFDGETWTAYRAKVRPCLVVGDSESKVSRKITRGMPNRSTAPTLLVAPYYGASKSNKRAGYKPEFVARVRHCEYPQFFWEFLPHTHGEESILRLDHIQPIGAHHQAYKMTDYYLSDDAMNIIDDYLHWLFWGEIPKESEIHQYREIIEECF